MRDEIIATLQAFDADAGIRAMVMTGAGERAFSAGQDLEEAHGFDVASSATWIRSWEHFYSVLRGLTKPLVMALNGTAAGSAFRSRCWATCGSAIPACAWASRKSMPASPA